MFKITLEFLKRLVFVVFLRDVITHQNHYFWAHRFKTLKQCFEWFLVSNFVDFHLAYDNYTWFEIFSSVVDDDCTIFHPCFFEHQTFSQFCIRPKIILFVYLKFEIFVGVKRWMHNSQKVEHTICVSSFGHNNIHFCEKSIRLNIFKFSKWNLDNVCAIFEVVMAVFLLWNDTKYPFSLIWS